MSRFSSPTQLNQHLFVLVWRTPEAMFCWSSLHFFPWTLKFIFLWNSLQKGVLEKTRGNWLRRCHERVLNGNIWGLLTFKQFLFAANKHKSSSKKGSWNHLAYFRVFQTFAVKLNSNPLTTQQHKFRQFSTFDALLSSQIRLANTEFMFSIMQFANFYVGFETFPLSFLRKIESQGREVHWRE